jgi:hypothetical protein
MSWTKRQFVEQAFEEIGLASYAYDLTPEQLQSALKRLDAMLATWGAKGIRIGWDGASNPDSSDLNTLTTVTDIASEAIYTNLALRIAPSFGKQVSNETRLIANTSYNALISQVITQTPELQFPTSLPTGAGYKYSRTENTFFPTPSDSILQGNDGEINFY